jgi:hypothetical protein
VPAIIAAAGPSLDNVLGELAAVADRGVVIAADTALRPLLTRGISPQFVVAVDPQPLNARHFHQLPDCPKTWLVSEGSIDPTVVQPFGNRTFWFRVSNHEPWSWYNEIGVDVGRVDVWGSVLTAAFQVAVLAGCDPIVLVGADLSFTGRHPYCRGTTYEFDWAHLAAEGQPIEQAWRPFLRVDDQIRVPDVRGAETMTTPSMQSFRDWLVGRVRRSGRRVINATGAGIVLGEGIEQAALRDVLTTKRQVPSPSAFVRSAAASGSPAQIAQRLWDVHRNVCRNAQATPPIDRWREFCGDGFNLEKVGAAVERAARVLEHPETGANAPARQIPIPWTALGPAARGVVTHLPEAVTRLRSAFNNFALEPRAAGVDVDAQLAEAFDLLRSICATPPVADLASPVPADVLGRIPLGALHDWPVELGRAVRLFEGLLGDCWGDSPLPAAPEASYFTRYGAMRDASQPVLTEARTAPIRPHFEQACTHLALEWLIAATFARAKPADRNRIGAWWRSLIGTLTSARESGAAGEPITLVLASGSSAAIELSLPATSVNLVRVLTGTAHIETASPTAVSPLAAITLATAPSRTISLRVGGGRDPIAIASRPTVIPRVLTDEGVVRGVLPYATSRGAMCTALRGSESFLVREDGATEPGFVWPRPTNGELPFGEGGAVAWSVGTSARWPDGGSGHVMYRQTSDDKPQIETLPFAPQAGTWWRDRFYWACFPFGVGSWAPGLAPELAITNQTLFSVHGDADGLLLGPRARAADGAPERRLLTEGLRWMPGQTPQPVPLGPKGVASSRSTAHGWTAIARPEADAIDLVSASGAAISITCYFPFGIAWAGRSLLVSTADGELLLFERLTDVLESWTGGRP